MALAVSLNGTIYIVLNEENLERIKQHDPFDLSGPFIAALGPVRLPLSIVIAYAKEEEYDHLLNLGSAEEIVKYLRRGYTETPSDFERAMLLSKLPKQ